MGTIATLDTVLRARTSRFDNKIRKSRTLVQGFTSAITKIGIVGGIAGAALAAGGREFARVGDDIGKMSKRTGIATGDLQALGFAAEQSGTDVDQLAQAMFRANRRIGNAVSNTGPAVRALKELGLSAKELASQSTIQQFQTLVQALEGVSNQGRRSQLAFEILGDNWRQLSPLINQGSAEIGKLTKQFEKMGAEMSGKQIAQAEKLTDDLNIMRHQWRKLSGDLLSFVVPAFNAVAEAMQTVGELGSGVIEDIGRRLGFIKGEIPEIQKALVDPDTIKSDLKVKFDAANEERRTLAVTKLEELIELQRQTVSGLGKSIIAADLPQALQAGTSAQISFLNNLKRQNETQKANEVRKKQLETEKRMLEVLEDTQEVLEAGFDSGAAHFVEIL